MRALVALVAAAVGGLATGGSASAHPGAPFWTVSRFTGFEKQLDRQSGTDKGPVGTVSRLCRGIGERRANAFKHFACIERRRDGARFYLVYHLTGASSVYDLGVRRSIPSTSRLAAQRDATGDYLSISADVPRPSVVMPVIDVWPDQAVDVSWIVVCTKGSSIARNSGDYIDYSGMEHELRLPMYSPDACTAFVDASTSSNSRLRLRLYYVQH